MNFWIPFSEICLHLQIFCFDLNFLQLRKRNILPSGGLVFWPYIIFFFYLQCCVFSSMLMQSGGKKTSRLQRNIYFLLP